jgi:hypothetical protein
VALFNLAYLANGSVESIERRLARVRQFDGREGDVIDPQFFRVDRRAKA